MSDPQHIDTNLLVASLLQEVMDLKERVAKLEAPRKAHFKTNPVTMMHGDTFEIDCEIELK